MPERDWRERLAEDVAASPLLAAALLGIGGAILGLSYAAANATPEKRRKFQERMRSDRDAQRKAVEQTEARHRLRKEYFEQGEGKALYEQQAYVTIPRQPPYADATFQVTDGGKGFRAESQSAGLHLSMQYDVRDAVTSVHIGRGGRHRSGRGGIIGRALHVSPLGLLYPDAEFDAWVEDAQLAARLISAPGSTCDRIVLQRPDHSEINRRLWIEHLRRNPAVAAATGEEWRLRYE